MKSLHETITEAQEILTYVTTVERVSENDLEIRKYAVTQKTIDALRADLLKKDAKKYEDYTDTYDVLDAWLDMKPLEYYAWTGKPATVKEMGKKLF